MSSVSSQINAAHAAYDRKVSDFADQAVKKIVAKVDQMIGRADCYDDKTVSLSLFKPSLMTRFGDDVEQAIDERLKNTSAIVDDYGQHDLFMTGMTAEVRVRKPEEVGKIPLHSFPIYLP